jgi:predicted membrane channel-forming protein YqfA (hemolysin III family)
MLAIRLGGAPRPPTWMALGHGLIAASGLVTLIVAYSRETLPWQATWAIGVFVLAALGGIGIFTLFHLRERAIPVWIILGHGAVAVTGFLLLLAAIFS